jgi:uncharacterized OB-fold protein
MVRQREINVLFFVPVRDMCQLCGHHGLESMPLEEEGTMNEDTRATS